MDDKITNDLNFQGIFEVEMSSTGESALPGLFEKCNKNPGHEKFITPDDFSLDCLPCQYRDVKVLKLIKAISDLTVLVTVPFTSPNRPEVFPDLFPETTMYNTKGLCNIRTGSGMVWSITNFKKNKRPCACTKCLNSRKPSRSWAEVTVVTACHLVFDDGEGGKTKCRLWHDAHRQDGVDLEGFKIIGSNLKRDRCVMKCVTCDRSVAKKLREISMHYRKLCKVVHFKFGELRDNIRMTVVVSHPHGRHKKISVGPWIKRHAMPEIEKLTAYTYAAPTCPGSSGAPVYTLGGEGRWWLSIHTHICTSDEGNLSGFGWE